MTEPELVGSLKRLHHDLWVVHRCDTDVRRGRVCRSNWCSSMIKIKDGVETDMMMSDKIENT